MPVCPQCQQEISPGDKYCNHCGYQLPETSSDPTPAADLREASPAPSLTLEAGDYQVKTGYYLKGGWELLKQDIPGFVGFCLLAMVIEIGLQSVGIFGQLISFIISTPIWVGLLIVSAKMIQQQPTQFGDFFGGFRYFIPLLLYTIVGTGLVVIGLILLVIPGIYLIVGYTFSTLLIIDRRLDFWVAMESSRKNVQRHWFGIFVFGLVLFLLNLGGLLLLGVGLLVTIPWSMCAITVAYNDIFGLKATSY